ncbi:hypothetical protein BCY91_14020 [Pelobium manganitolerans]|uniref:ParB-like N-terminal domain-containing protein n=1 Tax=Pelobium manganitolerans TaxID=1842495 RepID=A0A419S9T2_9SPHI|nr:ParB/RepB/Spo0J family partition protein [Pelobium manganitolerans]RKD18989.1 hypothetical protein BCY91_14020 [Pelobium manganitolerans]
MANKKENLKTAGSPDPLGVMNISVNFISPSSLNIRKSIDEQSISELKESILSVGLIQPITLRPDADGYEIVCGERRYQACLAAGMKEIPAMIKNLTDEEAVEIIITENLQREGVGPIEESEAFEHMIESMRYSVEDIAAKIGKPESYVTRRLLLLKLIPPLFEKVKTGELPIGHAERLARVADKHQAAWHEYAFEQRYGEKSAGTLKNLKWWLEHNTNNKLAEAIFDTGLRNFAGVPQACTECPHNTACSLALFDEQEPVCMDPECFAKKTKTAYDANVEEAIKDPNVTLIDTNWNKSAKAKELRKEGFTVYEAHQVRWLTKPELEEVDREDYDSDEEYNQAVKEAESDFAEDMEYYNEESLKLMSAFDLASGKYKKVSIYESAKKAIQKEDSKASEILDLKSKIKRGRELDKEKVMKRLVDHMTVNIPQGPLTDEEFQCMYADFLNRIGYGKKSADIEKKFGIEKKYSASEGIAFVNGVKGVSPEDIGNMVRISLLSNYSGIFPNSLGGAIIFNLAAKWCPKELLEFELDQEGIREKREAKLNARIADLEKGVADGQ